MADEAVGTFVKETAEHKARPVLETSSSRTAFAARGSAPETEGGMNSWRGCLQRTEVVQQRLERSFGKGSYDPRSNRQKSTMLYGEDPGQLLDLPASIDVLSSPISTAISSLKNVKRKTHEWLIYFILSLLFPSPLLMIW